MKGVVASPNSQILMRMTVVMEASPESNATRATRQPCFDDAEYRNPVPGTLNDL